MGTSGAVVYKYFYVFLLTLVFSFFSMLLLRRLALNYRMLIAKDIALIGGIGIGLAVGVAIFLGVVFVGFNSSQVFLLAAASLVMLIFGVMDDVREASVLQKVLLQSIGASLLIALDIRTHIVYFDFWGNCVITFVWVLGITNAFNLLDIVDGLSAGVAFIVSVALFILASFYSNGNIQLLTTGLSAGVLGFLVFNMPPAKIYLGNAGSHFLGFLLAAVTLMVSYATVDRPLALLSPIIILGIPLLETACLIYFRSRKRIMPFHKSDDHMAFRLEALGMTQTGALVVLLGLALFYAVCGITISRVNNDWATGVGLLILLVSFLFFRILMRVDTHGR